MRKLLACLMVGVYLLGTFSPAFANSRSHKGHYKQKHRSGGHGKHYKKSHGKSSHSHKSHAVQKHRSGSHGHKKHFKKSHGNAIHAQKPHVVHKHQAVTRRHRPHYVKKHRHNRRLHQSRFSHRLRYNRHLYRSRYSRNYRSYPRIHYGHRHSYGHRVHILPYGFISFSIAGLSYYYGSGNYYRDYGGYYEVIQPPIGALIPVPPPGYRIVVIDSHEYYLSGGIYYVWDETQRGYRVVPQPEGIHETNEGLPETLESSLNLFVYPRAGQGENERANDRHDCHLWAVGETDFDPTLEQSSSALERSDYRRAITACLEAREYTVE